MTLSSQIVQLRKRCEVGTGRNSLKTTITQWINSLEGAYGFGKVC